MKLERWKQIDEIFSAALSIDRDKRASFLNQVCGEDIDLRKEVEALLAADQGSDGSMEGIPLRLAAQMVAEAQNELSPGNLIGFYKVISLLGAGGMGKVYKAFDSRIGREVAIKILPPQFSQDADRLHRFEQEARAAGRLNHPNIVTIYDIGSFESGLYIAMEFLEGKTLRNILNSEGLPLVKVMRIAAQLADAISRAHEAGIVHRDLKPENLIINKDGFIKVLDFGLAKISLTHSGDISNLPTHLQTEAGIILGTAAYMSPEQARGLPLDYRSDQFSFGTILYEMITGKQPFQRNTTVDTLSAIINENPYPASSLNPEVPRQMQGIIQRCLAKAPEDRYVSTRDLAKDLQNIRDHFSQYASSTRTEVPQPRNSKRKVLTILGVIFALAFLCAIGMKIVGWRNSFTNEPAALRINKLAVLPLENLSGDPNQEYFADGMTEALISELGKIGSLKVISRTSVMQYKKTKKLLREVARELDADGIVEGSVFQAGQKVRITAKLIDANADQQLWGQSYEGSLNDVLALQSEVARTIASQLQIQLTPEEKVRLSVEKKVNPESNEAYLKGKYCFNAGLNNPSYKEYLELLRKSFDYFHQAIKIDPQNAVAYTGLAEAYLWYGGDFREYRSKSKQAALRALELDDSLAEAHAALAFVLWTYDWDWPGAEREFKRAIQLNPSLSRHGYAIYLSASGRHSEAIAEIKKTQELDPMVLLVQQSVATIHIKARDYDQAIHVLQNLLNLSPNDPLFNARLGYAYYCKGMYQEAIRRLKWSIEKSDAPEGKDECNSYLALAYAESGNTSEAVKILNQLKNSNHEPKPYWIAGIYTALGEKDEAIEWLEKAFQQRAIDLNIKVLPHFEKLHSDPRFQDLIRRMGIP